MIKVFIKSYFNQNVISGRVGAGGDGFPVDGRCYQRRRANRCSALEYHRYRYTHNVHFGINPNDHFRTNPSLTGLQSRSRRYLACSPNIFYYGKMWSKYIRKSSEMNISTQKTNNVFIYVKLPLPLLH